MLAKTSAINGLDLSEPEANNNRRRKVIGC